MTAARHPSRLPTPLLALLLGLALGLSLSLAGCSLLEEPPPSSPAAPLPPPAQGQALYEDAVAALMAGDSATAAAWFGSLAQSTPDLGLKRRARYGQAAAALAAARTPQQAGTALALWRAWQKESPPSLTQEDPRLLTPALQGLTACLAARPAAAEGGGDNREIQGRLARLQEENQRLKQQLHDLEALHKELLERKNRLGR
jgi:hypothetical protein